MIKSYSCILLLFIVSCFAMVVKADEKTINLEKTDSWIIFDAQKDNLRNSWLNASSSYARTGFILNLTYNRKEQKFFHISETGDKFNFSELINTLLKNIQTHNLHYSLLFNLENQDVIYFNKEIDKIEEQVQQKRPVKNATIQNILNSGSLHFFSFNNFANLHQSVHYFYDYFEKHDISVITETQDFNWVAPQASMLYGMVIDRKNNKIWSQAVTDKRHSLQNIYLQNWENTGLQPVFIVSDGIAQNFHGFSEIANMPQYTHACHGEVTLNNMPIDYVYWLGDKIGKSYGHFNFPVPESKILKPYRSGYTFNPKEITAFRDEEQKAFCFKATPLKLTDNLQLMQFFNGKNIKQRKGCKIIEDRKRGKVLKVDKAGFLSLKTSEHYKIKDNSFTASFWFKTAQGIIGKHCILGTNTPNFREGLHLEIRANKPYFGFFINDISSKNILAGSQWYHLAFTYDKAICEKRIYIDGELTDLAQNSPSFIGSDTLFIGKCLGETTEESFCIDNLILWNRALSETEIKRLQTDDALLISIKQKENKLWLTGGCIALLIISLSILFVHLKSKKSGTKKRIVAPIKEPRKNAIFLFGNFSIFDNQSNNIVANMPPLIKELFMLLLVAYLKGIKGVTSEQLNAKFWEHLPASKARNNRNAALARLRKYIDAVDGLSIEYHEGNHFLIVPEPVFIDSVKAELLATENGTNNINSYFILVKKGKFLDDITYEWIEDFKEEKNRDVIQILSSGIQYSEDERLTEQVYLYILKLDDLHEEALAHLLKRYNQQGKIAQMNKMYATFAATYQKVYGEEFGMVLRKIVKD